METKFTQHKINLLLRKSKFLGGNLKAVNNRVSIDSTRLILRNLQFLFTHTERERESEAGAQNKDVTTLNPPLSRSFDFLRLLLHERTRL